jgi:hypothetical protein
VSGRFSLWQKREKQVAQYINLFYSIIGEERRDPAKHVIRNSNIAANNIW